LGQLDINHGTVLTVFKKKVANHSSHNGYREANPNLDAEIKKLHKRFGDFGSGYPSDERTVEFVRKHFDELVAAGVVRKKWETFKQIQRERERDSQRSLREWT